MSLSKRYVPLLFLLLFSSVIIAQSLSYTLDFNNSEHAFIAKTDVINLCTDPDWLPYESINSNGQYEGLMADFHTLWTEKIGIQVRLIKTTSWQQSLDYLQQRKCDILSSAQDIPERRNYLAVTNSVINYPFAIATRTDSEFIVNLRQVIEHRFVMVKGYAAIDILKLEYPNLSIITVDSVKAGLKMVERGEVFGFIDTVPSIAYQAQKNGISHINISGVLETGYDMSVGVRNDIPELLSIYNKAIAMTTEMERQDILNKWLSVHYANPNYFKYLWQLLLIAAILISFLLYRYILQNKHNKQLEKLNSKLNTMSHYDQLTEIANRYLLTSTFHSEMTRAARYNTPFSILLIDIDFFKSINDKYGHNAGDSILVDLAKLLTKESRDSDTVGRWGGEEFLIICPETNQLGAQQLAEHIRQRTNNFSFTIKEPVHISLGVTEYQQGETMERSIKRADDALYRAKQSGRNRVEISK